MFAYFRLDPRADQAPKAKAQAKAAGSRVRPRRDVMPMPLAPVGRPPAPSLDVLATSDWLRFLLGDIRAGAEVVVASLAYDHAALTDTLLRRLGGQSQFHATVLVDRETLEERACARMRPRLESLRRAGASIYLCRGSGRLGRFT